MHSNVLYKYIAIVAYVSALVVAQRKPVDFLPKPYECGLLREDQFYNLEKTVNSNEFPWMVKLRAKNNTFLRCMGLLIHRNYVLTTATCLTNSPPIDAIEVGWCKDCVIKRELEPVMIHPSYDKEVYDTSSRENDIGMVRFKNAVDYTSSIRPICLPSAEVMDIDFVGQHLSLTGVLNIVAHRLKTFVLIVGSSQCRNYFQQVNENFLCANTCDNGSRSKYGSALMVPKVKNGKPDHYYLIGILSTVKSQRCENVAPDIFVRVDRHLNWIVNSVSERENQK